VTASSNKPGVAFWATVVVVVVLVAYPLSFSEDEIQEGRKTGKQE
jgi:hypothetical protein